MSYYRNCLLIILGLVILHCTSPLMAHQIRVFAHAHGTEIHGQITEEGDIPVAKATVTAYGPSGEVLAETVSDEKGDFSMKASLRCDWRIVASAEGHQATYTVPESELPPSLPQAAASAGEPPTNHSHEEAVEAASHHSERSAGDPELHRQIIAMRNDIDRLKNKLQYRDILGGVGYILGVIGIAAYFLGGRRRQPSPPVQD